MKVVLLGLIGMYRTAISPLFPASCRFHPTCSEYAAGAVARHGIVQGCWLTLRRLLRCHPWHSGGVDPVPDKRPL